MATEKSPVPEKRSPLTLVCTRSESAPVCQLVRRIAVYNEVLWYVGLEIREENGIGELAIAIPPVTRLRYPWADSRIHCQSLATILLANVLACHHCIVAVELTYVVARNPLLLSLLERKQNIRKLTISDVPYCEENVLDALVKLVSPSNQRDTSVLEKYFCFSVKHQLLVVPQDHATLALTTLDVADLYMSAVYAGRFIDMLLENDTITDLTVGACVFTYGCMDLLPGFVTYLEKQSSALKKLTVRTPEASSRALQSLVKAVVSTTTLEEVVVDINIYDVEDKALFAEIIAQSRSLRRLSITWTRNCVVSTILHGAKLLSGDAATRIEPWLLALPENTALSTLTVDLLGFTEEECFAFFRALALNKTLENVYIDHLPECAGLKGICQIIRDSRLAKTVHIVDYHVSTRSLPMLPECQEVTSLAISSFHLPDLEILRAAFQILASCSHVTSLCLCVQHCFLDNIQAAMAAYIAGVRTLNDIEIHVYVDIHGREDLQHDTDPEALLVKALASNLSLTRFTIRQLPLNVDNSKFLANAVINSQNLSELSFAVLSSDANNAFLHTLVSGIERNRSLLCVKLPSCVGHDDQLGVIRNVTRRNASLVARAARFVMGDHDPYNARAVELVSTHERVLSIVQATARVGAAEAATMVKRALSLRCLTGLNEYMKLTGVVKRRVECIGGRGLALQLDELSYDCWIHIRRFLTVADVRGTECSVKL